jgi:hypothetical protein
LWCLCLLSMAWDEAPRLDFSMNCRITLKIWVAYFRRVLSIVSTTHDDDPSDEYLMQVRLNSSVLKNATLSVVVHITIRNTGEIIKSIPVDLTQSSSVLQLQLSKSIVVVCTSRVQYQINLFHDLVPCMHVFAIATSLFRETSCRLQLLHGSMHACRLPFCFHWIKVGLA